MSLQPSLRATGWQGTANSPVGLLQKGTELALDNDLNANLVRRWINQAREGRSAWATPGFMPISCLPSLGADPPTDLECRKYHPPKPAVPAQAPASMLHLVNLRPNWALKYCSSRGSGLYAL